MGFYLTSYDNLTCLVREKGIETWQELLAFVRLLPYGRNENRHDSSLVISEMKGTCSSKHALLKRIADYNHIPQVKLILGIYKMNQSNTPGIGNILEKQSLDYIPEAHCYLNINGQRRDFTSQHADINHIQNEILSEIEIQADQVKEYKMQYHQDYIKKWLERENSPYTFEQIWEFREKCIENLNT